MKIINFIILISLLLLPGTTASADNINMGSSGTIKDTVDIPTQNQVVDVAIIGNIYFSQSNIIENENVDIYVLVRNNGNFRISSEIVFSIKNEFSEVETLKQIINLDPNEEKYSKVQWLAINGNNEISAEATVIGYIDGNIENNQKTTNILISPDINRFCNL